MRQQFYTAIRPATRFAKKHGLNPLMKARAGLLPIAEHDENDIFIVGYPKSGNTWFQNLVSGVAYGVNPLYAPDTLIQEMVPDVHAKRFYKQFWTPMFFKSHNYPQPDYRRVVYLIRDGRDALVSYYHYKTAKLGREPDFREMAATGEGLVGKWHEHVESWLANPYEADMIMIRYEDLKRDTVTELERFCTFAGIERERSWIQQVAESATFDKMHKKEKSGRYYRDDKAWPEDKAFVRRGVVGSYKDEMPPEVLELFLRDSQDTLTRLGYT